MIKKQKEKRVTIDKLAIMIEKGFAATAKDLSLLTARVDGLESRLDNFEKSVNTRFDGVISELKEIRKEIKVNNLKTQGDIISLDFRVSKLEKNLPS
jgi:hypothetical protein